MLLNTVNIALKFVYIENVTVLNVTFLRYFIGKHPHSNGNGFELRVILLLLSPECNDLFCFFVCVVLFVLFVFFFFGDL